MQLIGGCEVIFNHPGRFTKFEEVSDLPKSPKVRAIDVSRGTDRTATLSLTASKMTASYAHSAHGVLLNETSPANSTQAS